MPNIGFPVNIIISQQGVQGVPGNTAIFNPVNTNYRFENGQFQIYDIMGTGSLIWRALGCSGGALLLSDYISD